jgi:hypothetical protein
VFIGAFLLAFWRVFVGVAPPGTGRGGVFTDQKAVIMGPEESLELAHSSVRRGDFETGLLGLVRDQRRSWSGLGSEPLRLKAAYIVAEVLDHFGEYTEVKDLLTVEGPSQVEALGKLNAPPLDERDITLFKRRIWVALAWATVQYRSEHYKEASDILGVCEAAVNIMDPEKSGMFGTRARVAYSRGQVARQLRQHSVARQSYEAAIIFANRRFVAKTKYAELPDHPFESLTQRQRDAFERDRLLAQWTIGKCLALGLGWIAFITGHLSTAATLMSAGYALLRGTKDGVHRAYVTLLLGAVERAKAGADENRLQSSKEILEDAAKGLATHPTYKFRAAYELALAYYVPHSTRHLAEDSIRELREGLGSGIRSARWNSSTLVIESRIARLNGNHRSARTLAQRAVDTLKGAEHTETQSEAYIALGEALLAEAADHRAKKETTNAERALSGAIDAFKSARDGAGQNPKISAVAHLHLADAYRLQGDLAEAYAAYAAWSDRLGGEVEHGFVRSLAQRLANDLAVTEVFILSDGAVNLSTRKADHVARLVAFLLRRAAKKGWTADETAKNFGVTVSTLNKLKQELRVRKLDVPIRPQGRPRTAK